MFERLTAQARMVIVRARQEAEQLHHPEIGSEHLLLALAAQPGGTAHTVLQAAGLDEVRVRAWLTRSAGTGQPGEGLIAGRLTEQDAEALRSIGIDLDAVLSRIEESFGPGAVELATLSADPPRRGPFRRRGRPARSRFTARGKKVIELSLREALRLRHNTIDSAHILLGLLRDGGGPAQQIITDAGIDPVELRTATESALRRRAA